MAEPQRSKTTDAPIVRAPGSDRVDASPSANKASDEELMLRYQRGDAPAFEVLLRRHRQAVFHFALRFLGQREAAEDALQEIFLRVVKNAPRYEKRAKFTTWMYTIARNYCIDTSRKARFRRTSSLHDSKGGEDTGRNLEEMVEGTEPAPDRNVHNRRLKSAIEAALEALGDEQREVFLLREHGGLAFKEIAEITGVSENTVKSRMRYALEKLREALRMGGFAPC